MGVKAQPAVTEQQLMALLDHTSAVIYMRGLDGRYLLVNREFERLFDVRRDEIVGLTDHDLFPGEVADSFRANDLMAIGEGRPIRLEETAPGDDGPRTYITVKFPLMDDRHRPYAICGISTDITERKRAEEEVRRLNEGLEERVRQRTAELEASTKELDAFAYSVSHDLRAPLRSLAGFSEVLQEDYADVLDEVGRGYLNRIETNATRMAGMIDDLLNLSRATRVALRREQVDLTEAAREVIAELRDQDPGRQAQVTIADGLIANGDPQLIHLVLLNLLGNAWKFTARQAPAAIEVERLAQPGPPVFVVRDNGAGFDMRYSAKLFDPFQRLHSHSEFEGTGIGLAIVHRIVQRHGGRIWAHSEPGHGASFSFTLTAESAGRALEDR
jgi:PAS domain S-box-containing protein